MSAKEEAGFVLLEEVSGQEEAMVVVSLLRGAGIECRAEQESIGAIFSLSAGKLGAIRIMVRSDQHQLAQELLAAESISELLEEDEENEEPDS
jgi:hypothetical protein